MSWLTDLASILSGGSRGATTPPYGGGAVPGVPPQAQPQQSIWPSIVGAGAALGSAALQANSQGKANQAITSQQAVLNQMAQQEQARREYYSSILMPNILRGLGQRNPQILQMAMQHLQALPGYGAAPAATAVAPQQPQTPATNTQAYQPPMYSPAPSGPNNQNAQQQNLWENQNGNTDSQPMLPWQL